MAQVGAGVNLFGENLSGKKIIKYHNIAWRIHQLQPKKFYNFSPGMDRRPHWMHLALDFTFCCANRRRRRRH